MSARQRKFEKIAKGFLENPDSKSSSSESNEDSPSSVQVSPVNNGMQGDQVQINRQRQRLDSRSPSPMFLGADDANGLRMPGQGMPEQGPSYDDILGPQLDPWALGDLDEVPEVKSLERKYPPLEVQVAGANRGGRQRGSNESKSGREEKVAQAEPENKADPGQRFGRFDFGSNDNNVGQAEMDEVINEMKDAGPIARRDRRLELDVDGLKAKDYKQAQADCLTLQSMVNRARNYIATSNDLRRPQGPPDPNGPPPNPTLGLFNNGNLTIWRTNDGNLQFQFGRNPDVYTLQAAITLRVPLSPALPEPPIEESKIRDKYDYITQALRKYHTYMRQAIAIQRTDPNFLRALTVGNNPNIETDWFAFLKLCPTEYARWNNDMYSLKQYLPELVNQGLFDINVSQWIGSPHFIGMVGSARFMGNNTITFDLVVNGQNLPFQWTADAMCIFRALFYTLQRCYLTTQIAVPVNLVSGREAAIANTVTMTSVPMKYSRMFIRDPQQNNNVMNSLAQACGSEYEQGVFSLGDDPVPLVAEVNVESVPEIMRLYLAYISYHPTPAALQAAKENYRQAYLTYLRTIRPGQKGMVRDENGYQRAQQKHHVEPGRFKPANPAHQIRDELVMRDAYNKRPLMKNAKYKQLDQANRVRYQSDKYVLPWEEEDDPVGLSVYRYTRDALETLKPFLAKLGFPLCEKTFCVLKRGHMSGELADPEFCNNPGIMNNRLCKGVTSKHRLLHGDDEANAQPFNTHFITFLKYTYNICQVHECARLAEDGSSLCKIHRRDVIGSHTREFRKKNVINILNQRIPALPVQALQVQDHRADEIFNMNNPAIGQIFNGNNKSRALVSTPSYPGLVWPAAIQRAAEGRVVVKLGLIEVNQGNYAMQFREIGDMVTGPAPNKASLTVYLAHARIENPYKYLTKLVNQDYLGSVTRRENGYRVELSIWPRALFLYQNNQYIGYHPDFQVNLQPSTQVIVEHKDSGQTCPYTFNPESGRYESEYQGDEEFPEFLYNAQFDFTKRSSDQEGFINYNRGFGYRVWNMEPGQIKGKYLMGAAQTADPQLGQAMNLEIALPVQQADGQEAQQQLEPYMGNLLDLAGEPAGAIPGVDLIGLNGGNQQQGFGNGLDDMKWSVNDRPLRYDRSVNLHDPFGSQQGFRRNPGSGQNSGSSRAQREEAKLKGLDLIDLEDKNRPEVKEMHRAKPDEDIRKEQIKRIRNPIGWLGDTEIDAYIKNFIRPRATDDVYIAPTDFFTYIGNIQKGDDQEKYVRAITPQPPQTKDNVNLIIIPANVNGNHWVFYVIDREDGIVRVYDSNQKNKETISSKKEQFAAILYYIRYFGITTMKGMWKEDLKVSNFMPQQSDDSSCGILILKGIDVLATSRLENDVDIIGADGISIQRYRNEIADQLAGLPPAKYWGSDKKKSKSRSNSQSKSGSGVRQRPVRQLLMDDGALIDRRFHRSREPDGSGRLGDSSASRRNSSKQPSADKKRSKENVELKRSSQRSQSPKVSAVRKSQSGSRGSGSKSMSSKISSADVSVSPVKTPPGLAYPPEPDYQKMDVLARNEAMFIERPAELDAFKTDAKKPLLTEKRAQEKTRLQKLSSDDKKAYKKDRKAKKNGENAILPRNGKTDKADGPSAAKNSSPKNSAEKGRPVGKSKSMSSNVLSADVSVSPVKTPSKLTPQKVKTPEYLQPENEPENDLSNTYTRQQYDEDLKQANENYKRKKKEALLKDKRAKKKESLNKLSREDKKAYKTARKNKKGDKK